MKRNNMASETTTVTNDHHSAQRIIWKYLVVIPGEKRNRENDLQIFAVMYTVSLRSLTCRKDDLLQMRDTYTRIQ